MTENELESSRQDRGHIILSEKQIREMEFSDISPIPFSDIHRAVKDTVLKLSGIGLYAESLSEEEFPQCASFSYNAPGLGRITMYVLPRIEPKPSNESRNGATRAHVYYVDTVLSRAEIQIVGFGDVCFATGTPSQKDLEQHLLLNEPFVDHYETLEPDMRGRGLGTHRLFAMAWECARRYAGKRFHRGHDTVRAKAREAKR